MQEKNSARRKGVEMKIKKKRVVRIGEDREAVICGEKERTQAKPLRGIGGGEKRGKVNTKGWAKRKEVKSPGRGGGDVG